MHLLPLGNHKSLQAHISDKPKISHTSVLTCDIYYPDLDIEI